MLLTAMTPRFLAAALVAASAAVVSGRQAPERTLVVDFYALGSDGAIYVTNNTISGGEGAVVKILP